MEIENYQTFLNTKPRKGDLKKMEIIHAAIECVSTIGYEKTTYQAIADRIGSRRAHVAYHFQDKRDIFKACINYINNNYQRILVDHIEGIESGREILARYAEAPFIWAQNHSDELSVMLLFYYLCAIDEEYKYLNNQIRERGVQRLLLILTQKCELSQDVKSLEAFAKRLQNLMTGTIIDAVTTQTKSLEQVKLELKEHVNQLVLELERK